MISKFGYFYLNIIYKHFFRLIALQIWSLSLCSDNTVASVLLIWFPQTPTSCSHPQFNGGDTGTNWHTVSFLNIYSQYVPACSWQPVLSMQVNVDLINEWVVWLGLTVSTDGDLFLCCHEGEEVAGKARITKRKESIQDKKLDLYWWNYMLILNDSENQQLLA